MSVPILGLNVSNAIPSPAPNRKAQVQQDQALVLLESLVLSKAGYNDCAVVEDLRRLFEAQQDLNEALDGLSPSARARILNLVGAPLVSEILQLSREKDPALYGEGALRIGRRLRAGQDLAKAQVFLQVLLAQSEGAMRSVVAEELSSITGQGPVELGGRVEFLLSQLARQATDYRVLLPMMAGSMAFTAGRAVALGRLGSASAGPLTRGFGARVAASTLGFSAEVPTFVLAGRGLRTLSGEALETPLEGELLSAGLTLSFLKGAGFVGNQAFLRLHGVSELGATRLTRWANLTQGAIGQMSMGAGMMLGHYAEAEMGWRPHSDFGTMLVDTASSLIGLYLGMKGMHTLWPGLKGIERELGSRAQIYYESKTVLPSHRTKNLSKETLPIKRNQETSAAVSIDGRLNRRDLSLISLPAGTIDILRGGTVWDSDLNGIHRVFSEIVRKYYQGDRQAVVWDDLVLNEYELSVGSVSGTQVRDALVRVTGKTWEDLAGLLNRGGRIADLVEGESASSQVFNLEVAKGNVSKINRGLPEIVSSLVSLYSESLVRPLVGFDPKIKNDITNIQGRISDLQRYLDNLSNQPIIPIDSLPNASGILKSMGDIVSAFTAEMREKGMTAKFAREFKESLVKIAGALEPIKAGFSRSVDAAIVIQDGQPLHRKTATLAQVEGALLGGAVGDAFGAPFEFLTREQITEKNFDYSNFIVKGGYPPGKWTDDTLLTLAVLGAVLEAEGVVPRKIADYFVPLSRYSKERGFGQSTKRAIRSLENGVSWKSSGLEEGAGNGAAMRVAPIGILDYRDLQALKRDVILSSQITHTNYEGISGALGVAYILAKILRGEFNVQSILGETRRFIGPGQFSSKLLLAEEILRTPSIPTEEAVARLGSSGVVWESVASAIYAFLATPRDFHATLVSLARSGGDSDTMAAVAGTLSGAYNGIQGIPAQLLKQVEDRKKIQVQAGKLFKLIHRQ